MSATTLRATTLFIITQPQVYATLKNEFKKAVHDGLFSKPVIQDAEAKNLPYLQACIKEGLRIWPPVMGLMQNKVPLSREMVENRFIPGGTYIGYCVWGVHRNREVFEKDAQLFRPEKWLEVDEKRVIEMHKVSDLVFESAVWGNLSRCLNLERPWLKYAGPLPTLNISDTANLLDFSPL